MTRSHNNSSCRSQVSTSQCTIYTTCITNVYTNKTSTKI